MRWKHRFGGLPPSRGELEKDIDDEVRLHLDMRAKDFEKEGRDSGSARKEARRRFGDVERYREEMLHLKNGYVRKQERSQFWDEVRQDIRFGFRQLSRKPALPLMIIALLAIGVGATTAIFSVVKAVLLEPLPYESPEELVIFWETTGASSGGPASYPNFKDWREQNESFEDIGAVTYWHFNLTGAEGPQRVFGTLVSAGVLELLGVEPELGRTLLPDEDRPDGPRVVLISHGLWKRRYGGESDVLGEKILIDGEPFSIIGIMPAGFEVPSPWLVGKQTDLWMSLNVPQIDQPLLPNRATHWIVPIGRLKDGVSLDAAQEEMRVIANRLAEQYPDSNKDGGIQVLPLQKDLVGKAGGQLLILLGAAGLVLLISCVNVAGLLMAKAITRQAECAVRAALGASRARLIRQSLVENVPLSLLGGGLGFLLALWGIGILRSIIPPDIPRINTVTFDVWVFAFTLAVSVVAGILFSLAPAWTAAKTDLADWLKQGRGNTPAGRRRARNLLVAAQFAMTLVLANAAALMGQSYYELRDRDYGFDTEEVLTLGISVQGSEYEAPSNVIAFYDELVERVATLPGVRHAAAASKLPLEGGTSSTIRTADGHDFSETEAPWAEVSVVTSDYFQAMGIPLSAGSTFVDHDRQEGQMPAVVNRALVGKLWPDDNPIGKRFRFEPSYEWTVVGVVGDVRQGSPETSPFPEVYLPHFAIPPERQVGTMTIRYLVVRTDLEPSSVAASVRHELANVDSDQPISDIRTTAEILSGTLARRRFNTLLVGIFATIALILVSAGIYGVMSFFVAERTQEIGIRMALGASGPSVHKLVLGQGLKLATIGVVVGLLGVFATTKLTESMVYGVSPTDPVTLVAGTVFLVGVGVLGSIVPARRATRVDPIPALRKE